MNLASGAFLLFFLTAYALHWSLRGSTRKCVLVAASWLFYALWDWRFVGLLLLSTVLDHSVGARMAATSDPRARNRLLLLSLGVNLGVLAFFKYAGFFVESLSDLLSALGLGVPPAHLRIAVPVGVSFYTFRSLSYTLDIHRGQLKPTRSLLDYALYMGFFPLLGAGPIVRARQFLPQLARERSFDPIDLEVGFSRFVQGLLLKVFVADTVGHHLVDPVFARPAEFGVGAHWLAMAGFAVQVYADFAGYSSMAIGVSRAFGFRIAENFNHPYLAVSPAEFWRRWHISLTSWFRDYLWWTLAKSIPLGGSLRARLRWTGALVAVFLASGLWHGAGWTFVAWGGLHGLGLALSHQWRAWRQRGGRDPATPAAIAVVAGWAGTQLFACLAWVLFRSQDLTTAWSFLGGLAGSAGHAPLVAPPLAWLALLGFVCEHAAALARGRWPRLTERTPVLARAALHASAIIFLWYVWPEHGKEFIYFRF